MIELERDGELWIATLNRPDKANSVTEAMLRDLAEVAETAKAEGAGAFILTGRGKVFSAGADLNEMQGSLATSPQWERLSGAIAALPCLSVAALNGTLAGGAMGMVLACDLRIAVPGANFFYPVMKRGFLPQPTDPVRMAALIGPARSKLIFMAGARLDAEEALRIGLVDRLAEPEALMDTARALVADALAAKPDVVAGIAALCGKG